MPYEIFEKGETTFIKCSNCRKNMASSWNPFGEMVMLAITFEILSKIEKHNENCGKRLKKGRKAKRGKK